MKGKLIIAAIFMMSGLTFHVSEVVSAEYPDPNKTITIIGPFAPGGTSDGQIRAIAPHLSKHLGGVRVSVVNVVGAGGKLAYDKAYKATPDGYTLMLYNLPAPIITELDTENPRFKIADFVPIYGISVIPMILVVHADTWKTVDEFVREGQKRTVNIGATGNATASYFQAAGFVDSTKIKGRVIPFEGGSESTTALAGKHIDAVNTSFQTASPLIRAGKLRALIIFNDEPDPDHTDVLLSKESKWNIPIFPLTAAFVGPPNLAADKVRILENAFANSIKEPAFVEWAKRVEMDISPISSEKLKAITSRGYQNVKKYFIK